MKQLIFSDNVASARQNRFSLYRKMGEQCLALKNNSILIDRIEEQHDVGAGKGPHYQTSCAKFFDEAAVKEHVDTIIALHIAHNSNILRLRQGDSLGKLKEVQQFAFGLQVIPSIGPVRSQAIVQLSALFGLVSLDFYSYLPMHLSGGPGYFIRDLTDFESDHNSKDEENTALLEWNVKTVTTLQRLYNKELTYNKFENMTCEISRQTTTFDYFYFLPWIHRNDQPVESDRLQLFFRVDGKKANQWSLEAFDGIRRHCIFSDDPTTICLLNWDRSLSNGAVKRSTRLQANADSPILAAIYRK